MRAPPGDALKPALAADAKEEPSAGGSFEGGSSAWDVTREASASQTGEAFDRAGIEHREPGELSPGSRVGRYQTLDLLGRGGMGAVYRAYDPELDRIVAIKQVRVGTRRQRGQQRLLREAQAIARLSHPHVVQIFDVGRDETGGGVFLAMEFVNGPTLKQWLNERDRSYAEIARVFADAGEGLLAAHRQGLVHRDFKPDNVLIDPGGAAKVLDFGLAKGAQVRTVTTASSSSPRAALRPPETLPDDAPPRPFAELDPSSSRDSAENPFDVADEVPEPKSKRQVTLELRDASLGSRLSSGSSLSGGVRELPQLTRDGSRIGTPAYMPPEQILGAPADPRADQFSFAVALYEALFGRLPFAGHTPNSYASSVLEGAVRPVPKSTQVPAALTKAIFRALATSPEDRFDDLQPLLACLRHDPAKRRRRAASLGAAALLGVAATALLLAKDAPAQPDPCARAGTEIEAVWNEPQRERLAAALVALPRSFAREQSARITQELDALASDWTLASQRTCRRTAQSGAARAAEPDGRRADASVTTRDDDLLVVQQLCLDRALHGVRGLVEAFDTADADALLHGPEAVLNARRRLADCSDPASLRSMLAGGATQLDASARADRDELDRIAQLQALGAHDRAAKALATMGEPRARTWPGAMVLDWGVLVANQALAVGEAERARKQLALAKDLALGDGAALEAVELLRTQATVFRHLGEVGDSDRAARRAFELSQARLGPTHHSTLAAMADLGHAPYDRGAYAEALDAYRRAEDAARRVLPAHDPLWLELRTSLASSLAHLGRFDEAIGMLESVLDTRTRRDGAAHPDTVDTLHALAVAQLQAGRLEAAAEAFEHELELIRRDLPLHSAVDEAGVVANLAATMLQLDRATPDAERRARAESLLRGALERIEGAGGAPPQRAAIKSLLGACLNRSQRYDEAEAVLAEAVQTLEAHDRASSANGLMTRWNYARALRGAGKSADARAELRRGRALAQAADNDTMTAKFSGALEGDFD